MTMVGMIIRRAVSRVCSKNAPISLCRRVLCWHLFLFVCPKSHLHRDPRRSITGSFSLGAIRPDRFTRSCVRCGCLAVSDTSESCLRCAARTSFANRSKTCTCTATISPHTGTINIQHSPRLHQRSALASSLSKYVLSTLSLHQTLHISTMAVRTPNNVASLLCLDTWTWNPTQKCTVKFNEDGTGEVSPYKMKIQDAAI
jgi:hypothetical protein